MIATAEKVGSGKQSVVMTTEPDMVTVIEELGIFDASLKFLGSVGTSAQGWTSFDDLMSKPKLDSTENGKVNDSQDAVIDGFILFTSGTTNLPKGCFRQYPKAYNHWVEDYHQIAGKDLASRGDRVCGVMPNNHGMGFVWLLTTAAAKAAMIFPGPAFRADTMLDTLAKEKITHTIMVPTMMHALIGEKAKAGYKLDHLRSVTFGGSLLTPDTLEACVNGLGAQGVENAYGATEGFFIRSFNQRNPAALVHGASVSAGWADAGQSFKVVDPDTGVIVPLNTHGEIHATSLVVDGYIDGVDADAFYNDDKGRMWFKTGDQGLTDDGGRLFITERYKDM